MIEDWGDDLEELSALDVTLEMDGREGATVPVTLESRDDRSRHASSCGAWPAIGQQRWKLELSIREPDARLSRGPGRLVGIDLGTTNSALAWTDDARARSASSRCRSSSRRARWRGSRRCRPSSTCRPTPNSRRGPAAPAVATPIPTSSSASSRAITGRSCPARQIASAKSWLANPPSTAPRALLPWGVEDGPRLSPVEASLAHPRRTCATRGITTSAPAAARPLEHAAPIVLTVPASFDEEARELTVQAAHGGRARRRSRCSRSRSPRSTPGSRRTAGSSPTLLPDGALVLVCDVGGGTTDFSLMRASTTGDDLQFERIAIGEHLLLGGDNLDLALAALVEKKLTAAVRRG